MKVSLSIEMPMSWASAVRDLASLTRPAESFDPKLAPFWDLASVIVHMKPPVCSCMAAAMTSKVASSLTNLSPSALIHTSAPA